MPRNEVKRRFGVEVETGHSIVDLHAEAIADIGQTCVLGRAVLLSEELRHPQ